MRPLLIIVVLVILFSFSLQGATDKPIKDGFYFFTCKTTGGVLDIDSSSKEEGAQLIISPYYQGSPSQHFVLRNQGREYASLISTRSHMALTATRKGEGSTIQQVPNKSQKKPSAFQLFRFIPTGDGYFLIQNKVSNLYIVCNGLAKSQSGSHLATLFHADKSGDLENFKFAVSDTFSKKN